MEDLFDLFGIQEPKKEEKKEKGGKKEKKDKKKSSSTSKVESYKLPLTIYTAYREPLKMETGDKTEVTEKEVKDFLAKAYPEYASAVTQIEVKDASVFAGFKPAYVTTKGNVHMKAADKFSLGGVDFDLSSCLDDEEGEVSLEDLTAALKDINPVFSHVGVVSGSSGQHALTIEAPLLGETVLNFPVRLILFGRDKWQITEEEYKTFLKENGHEEEGFLRQAIEDMVAKKFPELDGRCELRYDKENNIVLVGMQVRPPKKETGSSAAKEEKYPTEDTTLSFVFKKVPLSPELFDGKKEVTKKEILAYAGTIFPEYENEKTEIRYDKEKKLIIPILVGSRKGAYSWM